MSSIVLRLKRLDCSLKAEGLGALTISTGSGFQSRTTQDWKLCKTLFVLQYFFNELNVMCMSTKGGKVRNEIFLTVT